MLQLSLEHPDAGYDSRKHPPKKELAETYFGGLVAQSEMLNDYFSIHIEGGMLLRLPLIAPGFKPTPEELPIFLLRLACAVKSEEEEMCIHKVSEELAFFYARYVDALTLQGNSTETDAFKFALEHELLPDMKRSYLVRKSTASAFEVVTRTENLY